MRRFQIAWLLALIVAAPAMSYAFLTSHLSGPTPCFRSGNAAYRFSRSGPADVTVRVDYKEAHADMRMQLVDDPTKADFVLIDDGSHDVCEDAASVKRIRLDDRAADPDLTVALSRAPAAYKVFVRSSRFSTQDAAALFAVLWRNAGDNLLARN